MSTDPLPRPRVEIVSTEDGTEHVVISRDNKSHDGRQFTRTYAIEGVAPNDKIKGVVEKILGDRAIAEVLP